MRRLSEGVLRRCSTFELIDDFLKLSENANILTDITFSPMNHRYVTCNKSGGGIYRDC
jgi:hypothetical protein